MQLKQELKDMAEGLGASLFGVTAADELKDAPEGHRPKDIMHDAESIIVLGMKYLNGQVDILPAKKGEDFFTGVSV